MADKTIWLAPRFGTHKNMNAKTKLTSKSGPLRRAVSMLLLFSAAAAAALWALSQSHAQDQSAALSKIAPWVLQHTADGKQAEFLVVLSDQADLSGAAALPTKNERGRYVYDALRNKSQATQGPILQWLSERGLNYQPFYIVNAILVTGSRDIAEGLAARQDVARIEGNPHIQNSLPHPGVASSEPEAPATIEPGIVYTH